MPSLTRLSTSFNRTLIAAALALGLATSSAASAARHHDPRLDDADLALEKAAVLLSVAVCDPSFGPKSFHECEKQLGKAISHLEDARQSLAAAIVAADGGW